LIVELGPDHVGKDVGEFGAGGVFDVIRLEILKETGFPFSI
jgi:hypothetical protein